MCRGESRGALKGAPLSFLLLARLLTRRRPTEGWRAIVLGSPNGYSDRVLVKKLALTAAAALLTACSHAPTPSIAPTPAKQAPAEPPPAPRVGARQAQPVLAPPTGQSRGFGFGEGQRFRRQPPRRRDVWRLGRCRPRGRLGTLMGHRRPLISVHRQSRALRPAVHRPGQGPYRDATRARDALRADDPRQDARGRPSGGHVLPRPRGERLRSERLLASGGRRNVAVHDVYRPRHGPPSRLVGRRAPRSGEVDHARRFASSRGSRSSSALCTSPPRRTTAALGASPVG